MIKHALASCAMIGLLATPLSLSAADKQSKEKTAMKGRVPIVAASRLLDKTVYDMKGRNTGEIEYLLIDAQSGDVRYALASLEGGDEERFVPIPWRALSTSRWSDGLRVRAEKAYLEKSQRYTQEEIAEITQPTVMTSVVDYWAPMVGDTEGSGTGAQTKSETQSGKQQGDKTASKASSAKPSDKRKTASGGETVPHILVGREFVATLMPAEFRSAEQIEGSAVVGSNGEEIGEIEELMIDTRKGRVAYVQVSHGGFLGLGEEVTPMPLNALSHSVKDNSYAVALTEKDLEKLPRFSRGKPPKSVRRQDLVQLYQRFDVTPYWAESAK